jgi:hypothetical protein
VPSTVRKPNAKAGIVRGIFYSAEKKGRITNSLPKSQNLGAGSSQAPCSNILKRNATTLQGTLKG